MMIRFRIRDWLTVFYVRKSKKVTGLNSTLINGDSMLMLDCDGVKLVDLQIELRRLMEKYRLPNCHIFSTGRKDSFHVYSWISRPFLKCLAIAADCNYIDEKYVYFSARRSHFTLRTSHKEKREIKYHSTIYSRFADESSPYALSSRVNYYTASKLGIKDG